MAVSRETKWNLGFFVLLALISAPGVTLLVRKQMQPGARRLADPPYVRRTEAYNNPLPASSASLRVVPPGTAQWVAGVSQRFLGKPPLRHEAAGGRVEPVMSRNRRFELLGLDQSGEGYQIVLLVWMAELGHQQVSELYAESAQLGGLQSAEAEPVDVPLEVIAELKNEGYVLPPERVAVLRLRFTPPVDRSGQLSVHLTWTGPGGEGEDVLDLARILREKHVRAKELSGPAPDGSTQEQRP